MSTRRVTVTAPQDEINEEDLILQADAAEDEEAQEDSPREPLRGDASTQAATPGLIRTYTTITRQAARGQLRHSDDEESPAEPMKDREDLIIREHLRGSSTLARTCDGKVDTDWEMELRFARTKYDQFRAAFLQTSAFMAVGVFGVAGVSLTLGNWVRVTVLAGVVAPIYLIYTFTAFKLEKMFLEMHGTRYEKLILMVLSIQTACIPLSEMTRSRVDYGMLVVHLAFVYNFTPFGTTAVHCMTVFCGMGPYLLLKIWFYAKSHDELSSDTKSEEDLFASDMCSHTMEAAASLARDLLVPILLLLYVAVVAMRRDFTMRLDMLGSDQLRAQRKQLGLEQKKCNDLLLSMLPRQILDSLRAQEVSEPQFYETCTVIFIDIYDFTDLCAQLSPKAVMEVLNVIYMEFDRLSDLLSVHKVETVGQIYMAVVGCPQLFLNHADIAAHFALAAQKSVVEMRRTIQQIAQPSARAVQFVGRQSLTEETVEKLDPNEVGHPCSCPQSLDNSAESPNGRNPIQCRIRVGLNSGKLRAGVVGLDSPRFKLFGDTVNTASRMESTCEPGKIQVSLACKELLSDKTFVLEDRGTIQVKGKGPMRTAYLKDYIDGRVPTRIVKLEPATPMATPRGAAQRPTSSGAQLARIKSFCALAAAQKSIGTEMLPTPGDEQEESTVALAANLETHAAYENAVIRNRREPSGLSRRPSIIGNILHRQLVAPRTNERTEKTNDSIIPAMSSSGGSRLVTAKKWGVEQMNLFFLLVPASHKERHWMELLQQDMPKFTSDMLDKRIFHARHITLAWLVGLSVMSMLDMDMDRAVLDTDLWRLGVGMRIIGNSLSGLCYLVLLSQRDLFHRHAQSLTIAMLTVQGASLIGCGFLIYNGDSALVSAYGCYVLLFNVCSIGQRLALCALAVLSFVVIEFTLCTHRMLSDENVANVGFLFVFFFSIACGVHLEEHLQHVSHYEQRHISQKLEDTKTAQNANEQLLTNLLPKHVVNLVSEGVSPIAEVFHDVTVIFTDITGFTAYSSKISPSELVEFLNAMFSSFDEIILSWGLYKVEIIGDAYFISAGCPKPLQDNPPEYAMRAVEVALAMQRSIPLVCECSSVQMRVGIHTGSVVAGVVGKKGPRYHLFGATVAYANLMESTGFPGRVQVSDATYDMLKRGGYHYEFEERRVELDDEQGTHRVWLITRSLTKEAFQIKRRLMMERRRSQETAVF